LIWGVNFSAQLATANSSLRREQHRNGGGVDSRERKQSLKLNRERETEALLAVEFEFELQYNTRCV